MSSSRESLLLRGASAASAQPWQRAYRPVPEPRPATAVSAAAPTSQPEPRSASQPGSYLGPERRSAGNPATGRRSSRLGEVYAEQLEQLREQARREGWAAGHAEGIVAAASVVTAAEHAAQERLAAVQVRWERRLASATAAMGAAVERLDATAAPVVDDLRDSVLHAVVVLVGDLLGRELAVATAPGLDALRRALSLSPGDVPVVVRLHPDDLAEIAAEDLDRLPTSVSVVGDDRIERAGAVAEAGNTRVDAQLSAALERVRSALRS